jgi:hypothetical protein
MRAGTASPTGGRTRWPARRHLRLASKLAEAIAVLLNRQRKGPVFRTFPVVEAGEGIIREHLSPGQRSGMSLEGRPRPGSAKASLSAVALVRLRRKRRRELVT